MRSLRQLAAAVVLAMPHVVSAQAVWWPGDPWGPWVPAGAVGPVVYPLGWGWGWAGSWGRGAHQYDMPPCYRIGRCTLDDVVHHLGQLDRLDRLAPAAPAPPPVLVHEVRRVEPTDPRHVQPAYAGSGEVRPQFAASGSVRE
jgi:hypothetical protein